MIYLELFWAFLKVGCFAFGGAYGAIPLIREVVLGMGWLSDSELSTMIAVSESTPGPIMVNLATYVGSSQAGFFGALAATAAVILPAFLIILLLKAVLDRFLENPYVQAALNGLKPCIIGIILATGLELLLKAILPEAGEDMRSFDFRALLIFVFLAVLSFVWKKKSGKRLSPIWMIVIAAGCGMAAYI